MARINYKLQSVCPATAKVHVIDSISFNHKNKSQKSLFTHENIEECMTSFFSHQVSYRCMVRYAYLLMSFVCVSNSRTMIGLGKRIE
jgi:hypothetical protein